MFSNSTTQYGSYQNLFPYGMPAKVLYWGESGIRSKDVIDFTVVNGLVQGDKKTPNPITFEKRIYSAGHGTIRRGEIHNGFVWVDNWPDVSYYKQFYNDFQYSRESGVLEAAGGFTPDTVFPAEPWKRPLIERSYFQGQVRDQSLSKLFDEVRNGPNLIVDLAEGGATLRMLKSTLRLRKVAREFFDELVIPRKLRNASKGQQRLDYITKKWLEYRYGWSPLVYSIYDSLEQLDRQIYDKIYTFSARSGVNDTRRSLQTGGSFSTYVTTTQGALEREVVDEVTSSWRCETQIQLKLPQGQQIWDWTSLNPASIAWELLPLSFVADWLISIGDYLELLENSMLYAKFFHGGYRTDTFKQEGIRKETIKAWGTDPVYSNSSMVTYYSKQMTGPRFSIRYKNRVRLDQIPMPSHPHVRVKLNAKRQLDAAALVHQLIGKRFR